MTRAYAAAAVVLVLTRLAAAQIRPDFSGVWKPVDTSIGTSTPVPAPPPGGPPPPPPPPRTISTTIAQSASELKVDRRAESGGREVVYNFVFKLDGTESVNQMGPIVFRTTA